MNNDIKTAILEIINDNPVRLREHYFINNYQTIYQEIINFCIDISDLPFVQKIWHYVNDISSYHLCKTCNVNKTTFHKNWKDGYRLYCSPKCSAVNDDTKNKRKETVKDILGVDNVAKHPAVQLKIEKTNIEIYGDKCSFRNKDVQKKWKISMIKNHNTTDLLNTPSSKKNANKSKETLYEDSNMFKTEHFKNKSKKTRADKTLKKYLELIDKTQYEILEYSDMNFNIRHNCGEIFDISIKNIYDRHHNDLCLCTKCFPISDSSSIIEKELTEYIKSVVSCEVIKDTTILNGRELDIYIPRKNLAIELNGLYYHSELFRDDKYHLSKSLGCQAKDISLIHIYEDEWKFKKDIVKSILNNRLGVSSNTIYARKCVIKDVPSDISRKFLDMNHIQGYTASSHKIGLYHNDILVSLMCFNFNHRNKIFELVRFCNILNTNIIGSASKLFTYFIKNNSDDISEIVSYSDLRLYDGKLYEILGFTKSHLSKPNYFWTNGSKRFNKTNFSKAKLVKQGYDANLSESEIMNSRKFYKLWNCGTVKWIYQKYVS